MFTFALAPTLGRSDQDLVERYQPLISYLSSRMDTDVQVVKYPSYSRTIEALRANEADAALMGMRASDEAQEDGSILPILQTRGVHSPTSTYRSVIVSRTDSEIMSLLDLSNREIALVDGQSTSGWVMPRTMLREARLDPDNMKTRILGSHREVAEAVLSGDVDAGAFHANYLNPPNAERAVDYARMRVLARSREIPRGPLVVRTNLDLELCKALREALLAIHEEDPQAARLLLSDGLQFTSSTGRTAPTLKSIAALAGVSYATVSRVVNNNGYVSEALRKRIQAIVDEVGYAPNGNARVLLGRALPLVAMVASLTDAVAMARAESHRAAFEEAKLPMVIVPAGESLATSPLGQILRDRRLGAVIVYQDHADDPLIRQLGFSGLTVVAVTPGSVPPGVVASSDDRLLQDVLALVSK